MTIYLRKQTIAASRRMWYLLAVVLLVAWASGSTNTSHVTYHYVHQMHPYHGGYQSRFENVDLDLILSSRRLVSNYVACLMDTKPCTAEGDELKKILPDALHTQCAKCNPKQKEGAKKVISTLQKKYPEQWRTLSKKWDLDKLKTAL